MIVNLGPEPYTNCICSGLHVHVPNRPAHVQFAQGLPTHWSHNVIISIESTSKQAHALK